MTNSAYKLSEYIEVFIRAWQLRHTNLTEIDNIWEDVVIINNQTKETAIMRLIAILLLALGLISIGMSTVAFGDIGVAILISGVASLLSGIGFFLASRKGGGA